MDAEKPKKAHKVKKSGTKAKKKKEKGRGKVEKHNPKAFTFSGGVLAVNRRVRHALEKSAKKDRKPRINKNPDVPPPFVVVVQGPPGVGKTTLVRSLVKHYAKQKLVRLGGPVTLVSSRVRRLTIVECPQDMAAMLDLAKVADLVLLMVDASFGFELETFEFINILQVQGFPRVIGVLTHMDAFKENKQLKKTRKAMKHRFWAEVYEGAKVMSFSGLQYGRYNKSEVANLARFIASQKPPLLSWRQSHPYLLALRWEDQTDPSLPPEAPRRLEVYGYVCGGRLREGSMAHLAGVGDFPITAIKSLVDPCPHPTEVEEERNKQTGKVLKKQNTLRSLAERHLSIYAPGSEVGSITVDSEAMYIHLPEVEVGFTDKSQEGKEDNLPEAVKMVRALQGAGEAGMQGGRKGLKLLSNSAAPLPAEVAAEPHQRRRAPEPDSIPEGDADEEAPDDDDDDESSDGEGNEEEGDADDEGKAHKERVLETARLRFARGERLEEAIYGSGSTAATAKEEEATDHATIPLFDEEDAAVGGARAQSNGLLGNVGDLDGLDSARMLVLPGQGAVRNEEGRQSLKERKFITGGWSSAEEEEDPKEGEDEAKEEKEDEAKQGKEDEAKEEVKPVKPSEEGKSKTNVTKADYSLFEGFSDGMAIAQFVRVRLDDVPAACVANFKRERPLILGGLLPGESRLGLTQMRVKRHRWHPKLLKSGDALLISCGWRRFQTVPTFSMEDRGEKRMRYLKYTLEHAHCTMTTYCPMMPPNTGVVAFRSWNKVGHFRVCATGVVLESAPNFQIKKKLKLVGEPYKIFKNTAFVRNMFNSDLEVSKYMHSKIQTVSGVRGEVKKAEGQKGNFRATFEDRILMSDIVVCKCWIGMEPKEFYHPVIDVPQWRPARLIGELRASKAVPVPNKADSAYGKQLVRPERRFNPLYIKRQLQEALPFADRERSEEVIQLDPARQAAAVVSSQRELAVNTLLERLQTVKSMREKIKAKTSAKKKEVKQKRDQWIQEKRDVRTKESKKQRYVVQGKKDTENRKRARLE